MRFWTRKDELEERLRSRHQARTSFVRDVAARMSASSPRRSSGVPARPTRFALVFAVLAVVGLAAFGGFGYAASGGNLGILGPVHIVGKTINGTNNGNDKGKGGGGTTTSTSSTDTTTTDTTTTDTSTSSTDTSTPSTDTKSASDTASTDTQTGDDAPGNSGNTPADDQYKPGCGQGDKNHTHTGPPGNHNGFPGKCP